MLSWILSKSESNGSQVKPASSFLKYKPVSKTRPPFYPFAGLPYQRLRTRHPTPRSIAMLPVKSLLNPAPSGPPTPRTFRSPDLPSPAPSYVDEPAYPERRSMARQKVNRDSIALSNGKPKDTINYPPFEDLDEKSMREMQRFQVNPLGQIHNHCRQIPYASGKKDFHDRTNREGFQVFHYTFKVPGDENEYTVMWDYVVGLVRMTPFFKCCHYAKTMPAKMLNLNPGLKNVTHSITGGSISAQGYWMSYNCAKAVCATFCYRVAGALVPIFGPNFPSICIKPTEHDFERMTINPSTIIHDSQQADYYRRVHAKTRSHPVCPMSPPKRERRLPRINCNDRKQQRRPEYARHHVESYLPSYGGSGRTDSERDFPPRSSHDYHYQPEPLSTPIQTGSRWTTINEPHGDEKPAVPSTGDRSLAPLQSRTSRAHHQHYYHEQLPHILTYPEHIHSYPHQPRISSYYRPSLPPLPAIFPPLVSSIPSRRHNKRSAEFIDSEYEYGCEYDRSGSRSGAGSAVPNYTTELVESPLDERNPSLEHRTSAAGPGAEKNAAILLMNLSVRDYGERGLPEVRRGDPSIQSWTSSPTDIEFPRIKRLRVNSV